jgi:hypothetical protein
MALIPPTKPLKISPKKDLWADIARKEAEKLEEEQR